MVAHVLNFFETVSVTLVSAFVLAHLARTLWNMWKK